MTTIVSDEDTWQREYFRGSRNYDLGEHTDECFDWVK